MDSTRQHKYAKLIQKELSEIFLHHGKEYYGTSFVTITEVRVSPDLALVKVYLSLFKQNDPDKKIKEINGHVREIRKQLGDRMKNSIRHIPELVFYYDFSTDYADNIEKLLNEIPKTEHIEDEINPDIPTL